MSIKSIASKLNDPNRLVDLSIKQVPPLSKIKPALNKEQVIEETISDMRLIDAHNKLNEALSNANKAALKIKK